MLKFLSNRLYGRENVEKMAKEAGTILYANNEPYAIVPDITPEDATNTGYKFRCEPELDDICDTCIRKNTSWCYYCDRDHRFYCAADKPENWDCDTCVNDGDMSHLQCRYCHEGSCYIKKEEPLKFDHEPSGEVVGKVTDIEDTGEGIRVKIKKEDPDADTNSD